MQTTIDFFLSYLAHFFLQRKLFQKKCGREDQNTHFVSVAFFSKFIPFMRKCEKILLSVAGHRQQQGACALHAG